MAKRCINCGNLLLRDDAQFCNKCGAKLIVPPDAMVKAQAAPMARSPEVPQTAIEGERARTQKTTAGVTKRPVLKEQIAFPSRPVIRPYRPTPLAAPSHNPRIEARDTSIMTETTQTLDDKQQVGEGARTKTQEADLAELPTSQLSIVPAPPPIQRQPVPGHAQQPPAANPERQPWSRPTPPPIPVQRPVHQGPVTPMLPAAAHGSRSPAPVRQTAQAARPAQPAAPVIRQPARRRGRLRLFIVGMLLLVLLIGGVVTWLVEFHPFEVPPITQTTTPFQNASLGVSFQYPQGWIAQVDTQHGAASFFDANHTVQFNLNTVATSALSVDQYMKNTIDQLGMTGQKSLAPLAFAGQSWSQERGSVLKSGATYTETLLVTTHAGRLYALLLMAPAPIYTNADRLFFAPLRASFKFL